jgi:hypothetical protein
MGGKPCPFIMINSLRNYLAFLLLVTVGLPRIEAGSTENGAGNYGGVIQPASPSDPPSNCGFIQAQLTSSGNFTGALVWQGQRYPLLGVIRDGQQFLRVMPKKGEASSRVELEVLLGISTDSRVMFGILSERDNGVLITQSSLDLNGALPDPNLIEKLEPGLRISFIDPPDPTTEGEAAPLPELGPGPAEIPGDGFVFARVGKTKKRASRLVGRLPDAQGAFTAGSPLRGQEYTVFSGLYKKLKKQSGQLFGLTQVADNGNVQPDYTSNLRWGKAPDSKSTYYPSGIDYTFNLDALVYPKTKRGKLVPLLPQPSPGPLPASPFGVGPEPTKSISARILFRRGNISLPDGLGGFEQFFRQEMRISPFHTRMVGDNPHRVKIQVDAFSGRFHGSFRHPEFGTKTRFRGAFQAAILFTPGQGRGHFRPSAGPGIVPLVPLESGSVRINVN